MPVLAGQPTGGTCSVHRSRQIAGLHRAAITVEALRQGFAAFVRGRVRVSFLH